jgi:TonB family protein
MADAKTASPHVSDRILMAAFAVSIGVHLSLLVAQLLSLGWFGRLRHRSLPEVVYEMEAATEELRYLKEQLERTKHEGASAPSPAHPGAQTQIRIPDRPLLTGKDLIPEQMVERSAIVDLTNLVEASRGDPVLLSYFSAIREQIQQTANHGGWLAEETVEGLVYISFMLDASGTLKGLSVVADRSVPSAALRQAALWIVKSAAPFPPFPPSIKESSKAILVPLEFLLGSGS